MVTISISCSPLLMLNDIVCVNNNQGRGTTMSAASVRRPSGPTSHLLPRSSSSSSSPAPRRSHHLHHPSADAAPSLPLTPEQHRERERTVRQVRREKWIALFGGLNFFSGGASNRLTLSLQSQLPAEMDWALERLVQISAVDSDLIRLREYPGLLPALLGLIEAYLKRRDSAETQQHQQALLRRANEAGLVLRNLAAVDSFNGETLIKSKKLAVLIVQVLQEGTTGCSGSELEEEEGTTELRLYLLEVLETLAPSFELAIGRDDLRNGIDSTRVPSAAASSPAAQLYPLLVRLTRSNDRALLLAAYRLLLALGRRERSASLLSYAAYTLVMPPSFPFPHPVDNAVQLLALPDAELSTQLLDYLYEHTLLPSNAVHFCARVDLLHFLRSMAALLHVGSRKETLSCVIPVQSHVAERWYRSLPPRHPGLAVNATERVGVALGRGEEGDGCWDLATRLAIRLRSTMEPERGCEWMQFMFECDADSHITQAQLWSMYCSAFEAFGTEENPMLLAHDLIRLIVKVFPNAVPMVTTELPEGRFIIRGLRIRDLSIQRADHHCLWKGCLELAGFASISSLYSHIHHDHLHPPYPSPRATRCCWKHCSYASSQLLGNMDGEGAELLVNELSLHLRTHLASSFVTPSILSHPSASTFLEDASGTVDAAQSTTTKEPIISITLDRYHAVTDQPPPTAPPASTVIAGNVIGIPYLACLLLRNVARTIKDLLPLQPTSSVPESVENDAAVASTTTVMDDAALPSIVEAMDRAGKVVVSDPIATAIDSMEHHALARRNGIEALLSVETSLFRATVENHAVGFMLAEVMMIITQCSLA